MPLNNCSLLFRSESYWLRFHESCYLVIFPKVQRILYSIHFKCILEFSFITQHSKKGESELIKIKITVYCSTLSRCHYSFLNAMIPLYMNLLLQTDAKRNADWCVGGSNSETNTDFEFYAFCYWTLSNVQGKLNKGERKDLDLQKKSKEVKIWGSMQMTIWM